MLLTVRDWYEYVKSTHWASYKPGLNVYALHYISFVAIRVLECIGCLLCSYRFTSVYFVTLVPGYTVVGTLNVKDPSVSLFSTPEARSPPIDQGSSSFSIHQLKFPSITFIDSSHTTTTNNNRQLTAGQSPQSWLTMLTPTIAAKTSFLYAAGNTPATSLTRSNPHGQDVDILSLGCGDLRNVLYTTYLEKELRKPSFNRLFVQ